MKFAWLPIAAFALLAGCAQAPTPVADTREADIKAIAAAEEAAAKGWDSRDVAQIAAVYAPDASLFVPNSPAMKGSDTATAMKDMFGDPNLSLKFVNQKTEVAKSGDLGYAQGTYSMTMTDPKTKKAMLEKGHYVTVFAKQADGSWKAVSDINTPEGPATPVDAKK